jgi:hypothetical protein
VNAVLLGDPQSEAWSLTFVSALPDDPRWMRLRARWFLAALSFAPACASEEHHYELRDSLGVEFALQTRGSDYDFVAPDDTPEACGESRPGWGYAWSRTLDLCSACIDDDGSWSMAPKHDCRVTVCDADDACPQFGDWSFVCESGVCQDEESVDSPEVSSTVALQLCAATIPRGPASAFVPGAQPELDARLVELDCDLTRDCSLPLPAGCLQLGE